MFVDIREDRRPVLGDLRAQAKSHLESVWKLPWVSDLRTLGDLAQALSKGPLGRSVPIWVRDENVECSGESETVKRSGAAKRRRTFTIDGERLYGEFHAKPSDGLSPDFYVRIYFAVTEQAPRIRVGYVGRHFD